MLEEEIEFARVRDAKVMFAVDSLDMSFADAEINAIDRDARREFWKQYAIKRVTESTTTRSIGQSLGEKQLRTDSVDELGWFANVRHEGSSAQFPQKMKHVTKPEKNEEGEPFSSRTGPPSSRVDSLHTGPSLKTVATGGSAHGGCVTEVNQADTEQPSAGPGGACAPRLCPSSSALDPHATLPLAPGSL